MATFHIHEDQHEKENNINAAKIGKNKHIQQKTGHPLQDAKEKRSTLAVLSNVVHGQVQQVGKSKGIVAPLGCFTKSTQIQKKAIEKNVTVNLQNQQQHVKKVTSTKVIVEQTKQTFEVYEDVQKKTATTTTSVSAVTAELKSIEEAKEKSIEREPLREIDSHETPMSVSDALSPMSVDKSVSTVEDRENTQYVLQKHVKKQDPVFEVTEYQQEIMEYFRELEKKHRPKPGYMNRQQDITTSMRTILVDWIVEVAEEYHLHNETLYLAISYIDRFLSYMSVVRAKLQLVGAAATYIAAKYEEIYPPDVGEFVYITDDTYTKSQVLRMEQIILKILSFDLNVPSPPVYLNLFAVLHEMPDQVKFLALYLSELTLLEDEPYLHYLPSQITSAALALSRHISKLPIWCDELQSITKYSLHDLKELILHIRRSHKNSLTLPQQAIQEKYKHSKFMEVSTIKPIDLTEDELNNLIMEYESKENKS